MQADSYTQTDKFSDTRCETLTEEHINQSIPEETEVAALSKKGYALIKENKIEEAKDAFKTTIITPWSA